MSRSPVAFSDATVLSSTSQGMPTRKRSAAGSETEPESDEEPKPSKSNAGRGNGRIISVAHPLADFQKNIRNGDLISKAVEDLAWVIQDIVLRPFTSKRQAELFDCMRALRSTCLDVRINPLFPEQNSMTVI